MVAIIQAITYRGGAYKKVSDFKVAALFRLCDNGCVVINRKGACFTAKGWEIDPLCDMVTIAPTYADT